MGKLHITDAMDPIDAKRQKLQTLRLRVARYRRTVVVLLLVEVLMVTGLVLARSAAEVPGSPPSIES